MSIIRTGNVPLLRISVLPDSVARTSRCAMPGRATPTAFTAPHPGELGGVYTPGLVSLGQPPPSLSRRAPLTGPVSWTPSGPCAAGRTGGRSGRVPPSGVPGVPSDPSGEEACMSASMQVDRGEDLHVPSTSGERHVAQ